MENTKLSLSSDWEDVKSKIKEADISITDEDLAYEKGKEDALLERLAKKMKRTKEEVRIFIESISANEDLAG
ncbi:MAG: general stress protein CsbD [Sphingobacteriales bacterium]|nr:MAG: general stress protein CsbD [Sphingobacteriales bacterium]